MLLLAACHNNDFQHTGGDASLHLIIKSSESTIRTRGIEDHNDDGTVSEENLLLTDKRYTALQCSCSMEIK